MRWGKTSFAHVEISGVTPDQHHALLHAIDSALVHSGVITDTQHGVRTLANAHAHGDMSGIGSDQHHARSHDHSNALDGNPIALAGIPASIGKVSVGTYTGDNTANRAIPHGLGKVPAIVIIKMTGAAIHFRIQYNEALIAYWNVGGTASGELAVTLATTTNFYVGNAAGYPNSANNGATVYQWTCIAIH